MGDRKYGQRGYMDDGSDREREPRKTASTAEGRSERSKPRCSADGQNAGLSGSASLFDVRGHRATSGRDRDSPANAPNAKRI